MRYVVTFLRTESITMALDATSEQDARERFLSDGDEIDSRTLDLQVTDVDNRNTCEHCGEDITQDDLGEWIDTEGDRTCPAADAAGAGIEHVPVKP